MKIKSVTISVAVALAAVMVSSLLSGCKTAGYQRADKTGAGIANFRNEITKTKLAIDSTLKAMDQIALTANSNPRPAYEKYVKEVANLQACADKVRQSAQAMRENGQAYFDQWQEQLSQVKDENIRKLAEQRKAKLKEAFDEIREYTEPLKEQFEPWMSSLKDLQNYLANDMTVSGIAAAKGPFSKAKSQGQKVQKGMDDLIEALNDLAATLTPANVPPAPDANQQK